VLTAHRPEFRCDHEATGLPSRSSKGGTMHGLACTRHSGQHALIAICLCSQSECSTDCSAGNCLSARKKQREPVKEGLAQDNPNPIRTTAEQHLFWLLREQHRTSAGPPDYTAMMAHFNIAWLKQTKLMLLQVKAPALLCISAMQHVSRHNACTLISLQMLVILLLAICLLGCALPSEHQASLCIADE